LNGALIQNRFCNTNPLSLTATNASDKVIANLGVERVGDTKHGHYGVSHVFGVDVTGYVGDDVLGRAGEGGEEQGVTDG